MKIKNIKNSHNNFTHKIMYFLAQKLFPNDLEKITKKLLNNNTQIEVDYPLIEILVTAEDKRFFRHPGFDIFAILRAAFFYTFKSTKSGASTIEQQLVRTITQNKEYSLKRKCKEIILASALGHRFSKNRIAKTYLQIAYYGYNIKNLSEAKKKLQKIKFLQADDIPFACIALLKFPLPSQQTDEYKYNFLRRIHTIKNKFNFTEIKTFSIHLNKIDTSLSNNIKGYIPKKAFCPLKEYNIDKNELSNFIYMYIFKNIPFFLIKKPLIYHEVCKFISQKLDININDIFLTGSANLGFSLSPDKLCNRYKPLSSDLDFFVISESLFLRLAEDIEIWKKDTTSQTIQKKIDDVERMKNKCNFVDTWHIPTIYKEVSKCRNTMYQACLLINKLYGEKIVSDDGKKSASLRCYKNYQSAIQQISINIESALKKNMDKN